MEGLVIFFFPLVYGFNEHYANWFNTLLVCQVRVCSHFFFFF